MDEAAGQGGGDGVVAEDVAPAAECLVAGDDDAGGLVAGGDELEEQAGGLGLEGAVADLVDDEQGVAAQAGDFLLDAAGAVGGGEAAGPGGGGGEQDAVPGLAGFNAQAGGEHGLARAGRPEQHDAGPGGDEVECRQMQDMVAFHRPLVVQVEVLDGLAGGEPGGPDAVLRAVGAAGGDLGLQAGGEGFLVGPAGLAGGGGEPLGGVPQRGGLEDAGEVGDLAGGAAGHGCFSVVARARVRAGWAGTAAVSLSVRARRSARSASRAASARSARAMAASARDRAASACAWQAAW